MQEAEIENIQPFSIDFFFLNLKRGRADALRKTKLNWFDETDRKAEAADEAEIPVIAVDEEHRMRDVAVKNENDIIGVIVVAVVAALIFILLVSSNRSFHHSSGIGWSDGYLFVVYRLVFSFTVKLPTATGPRWTLTIRSTARQPKTNSRYRRILNWPLPANIFRHRPETMPRWNHSLTPEPMNTSENINQLPTNFQTK